MTALRRIAIAVAVLGLTSGVGSTIARSIPPRAFPGPSIFLAIVPLSPDDWGIVTAFTDFGLVGYLVAAAVFGVLLGRRSSPAAVLALVATLVLALLHASWIWPWFAASPPPPGPGVELRILSLNTFVGRADPDQVVRAAADADVVVLSEITQPERDRLLSAGLGRRFPYERVGTLPPQGSAGTTVFSRVPVTDTTPLPAAITGQNWLVTLSLPAGRPVRLAAVHPAPPSRGRSIWTGDHELLRAALRPVERPLVVAGDFNAVDSQWPIRRLRAGGLLSSTDLAVAGWQPTWPAGRYGLPPLVGIDHILVSRDLDASASQTVAIAGTDHLGLEATILLPI